jgi:phosphatidate phosphatase APP1
MKKGHSFYPTLRLTDLPKPKGWGFVVRVLKTLEVLFFKCLEVFELYRAQKSIVGIPGLATRNYTALSAVVYNGKQADVLSFKPRRIIYRVLKGIPDLELYEKINFQLALTEHGLRSVQGNTETRGFVQLQLPWQMPHRPPEKAWLRMQPAGIQTLVGTVKLGDYEILSAPVFFITPEIKWVVISDIDDTIKDSRIKEAVGFRQIMSGLFKGNYYKYEAIEGMAELYRSLASKNCLFMYVTSTPYALAPFLLKFLQDRGFPEGPVFMRWLGYGRFGHKWRTLNRVLTNIPNQKCVLIGDSGELDLQIYRRVCNTKSICDRIDRVLIRHVPGTPRLQKLEPRETYYNNVEELKAQLSSVID